MANGLKKNEHYLGNSKLKKEGVEISYTKEQIKEYRKCKKNIIYFIEKYMDIIHVDRGKIKFKLWKFQKKLIKQYIKERFNIVNTSRQVGKSTTTVAFILHYILFNDYKEIGILANKEKTARKVLKRLQIAYENLPAWLQQGVVEWNKGSIELENGSTIAATSTSSNAARGDSYALLFVDEVSAIGSNIWDDFYSAVYPTISSGKNSKIILVSTPNGLNHFYKLWIDAVNGKNDYVPFSVTWRSHPERNEKWKRQEIANTSEEKFMQEHECQFLGSSNTLINMRVISRLTALEPIYKDKDNTYHIFERPIKKDIRKDIKEDHVYLATVDVAKGRLQDYSTISVIDITEYPLKQVARYRSNEISPLLFPNIIAKIGYDYNNAYVLIENNDSGEEVANIMNYDIEYDNLISPKTSKIPKTGNKKYELGLRTTTSTKRLGCSNFKDLIENDKLIISDEKTIHECASFISKGKSFEADSGQTDDLVMGLVNFSWLTSQSYFKDLTDMDTRKELFKKRIEEIEEDLLPLPQIVNGVFDSSESIIDSEEEMHDFLK